MTRESVNGQNLKTGYMAFFLPITNAIMKFVCTIIINISWISLIGVCQVPNLT